MQIVVLWYNWQYIDNKWALVRIMYRGSFYLQRLAKSPGYREIPAHRASNGVVMDWKETPIIANNVRLLNKLKYGLKKHIW